MRVLEFNEHNIAEVPQPRGTVTYECPFDHLGCTDTFGDFDEWFSHSLTHFQGYEPPPDNKCPFCDMTFHSPNGMRSWRQRMSHIETHHRHGHQLRTTGRFDGELYRYLWKHRIIGELLYKELTGDTRPPRSAPEQVYPSPPTSPVGSSASSGAYTDVNRQRFPRNRR